MASSREPRDRTRRTKGRQKRKSGRRNEKLTSERTKERTNEGYDGGSSFWLWRPWPLRSVPFRLLGETRRCVADGCDLGLTHRRSGDDFSTFETVEFDELGRLQPSPTHIVNREESMGGSVVRGLLSTLTAHSFLPLATASPNSSICFGSFSSGGAGRVAFNFRRASLGCIRVQEGVRNGVTSFRQGLWPHSVGRSLVGIRGTSRSSGGGSDALSVGISKMRKSAVECSGSSSAAETSSSENVQAPPKVRVRLLLIVMYS